MTFSIKQAGRHNFYLMIRGSGQTTLIASRISASASIVKVGQKLTLGLESLLLRSYIYYMRAIARKDHEGTGHEARVPPPCCPSLIDWPTESALQAGA